MSQPQIIVFIIIAIAFAISISNRLRMDLVGLFVIAALALSGVLDAGQALAGFGNPATITIWAMSILSGALYRTGVAAVLANQLLHMSGRHPLRQLLAVMITAAAISAFMNNIAVIALFLPVVMDLARETRTSPSKLLLPLTVGAFLGGTLTLVGTAPNLLASDALRNRGLDPFKLFDFAPVGLVMLVGGLLFMVTAGRKLLPDRGSPFQLGDEFSDFDIDEQMFIARIDSRSGLDGVTVAESRLGTALGLNLIAVLRDEGSTLSPGGTFRLQSADRLLLAGRTDVLLDLGSWHDFERAEDSQPIDQLISSELPMVEGIVAPASEVAGISIRELALRRRFGVSVLAVRRGSELWRTNIPNIVLEEGDLLLMQGRRESIAALETAGYFDQISEADRAVATESFDLDERIFTIRVPNGSGLDGKTLQQSRMGEAFGLTVLGVLRGDETTLLPAPDHVVREGDRLIVQGLEANLKVLSGLQQLRITDDPVPQLEELVSPNVALQEVILSPHSSLPGKTLAEIHFREKYGLTVLAVLRNGKVHRSGLRDLELMIGDALLIYGPRAGIYMLGSEPDFIALTKAVEEPPRVEKRTLAAIIMVATVLPVVFGWVHVAISALTGAALMVLSRSLTMDEAYRFIEWKSVFLVAGMLPLGTALEQTGGAMTIAEMLVAIGEVSGPRMVIAAIFLLALVLIQVVPPPAVIVLLAPVTINAALSLNLSPHSLMIILALAVSTTFVGPWPRPGNLMVMGPGNYRTTDYVRIGIPITIIALLVCLFAAPLIWPL